MRLPKLTDDSLGLVLKGGTYEHLPKRGPHTASREG